MIESWGSQNKYGTENPREALSFRVGIFHPGGIVKHTLISVFEALIEHR